MKRFILAVLAFALVPVMALADLTMQVMDDPADPRVVVVQDGSETVVRPSDAPVVFKDGRTIISIGACEKADVIVLFSHDLPAFDGALSPRYVFFCTEVAPDYPSLPLYREAVFGCTFSNGTITYIAGEPRPASAERYYVGNANSDKLHYHSCSSVDAMKESNKIIMFDRDQAVSFGFVPCKRCKP